MTGGERQFPILVPRDAKGRELEGCPRFISWSIVEPHREQARANHYQTLEQLAERGGLAPCELHAVLHDQRWRKMDAAESVAWLVEQVAVGKQGRPGSELVRDLAWFLRACADAVERGDIDAHDVKQALFRRDDYTIACPISEAAGTGSPENREHAAMLNALDQMATKLGSPWR